MGMQVQIGGDSLGDFEVKRDKAGKLFLKSFRYGVIYNKGKAFQDFLKTMVGDDSEKAEGKPSESGIVGDVVGSENTPNISEKKASGLGSWFDGLVK